MNISPWEMYLVLQLDSIRAALNTFSTLGFFLFCPFCLLFPFFADAAGIKNTPAIIKKTAKVGALVLVPAFILTATIPSSRTMAAMIVVPAIVNNPSIRSEAGELYELAKEALRGVVKQEDMETAK